MRFRNVLTAALSLAAFACGSTGSASPQPGGPSPADRGEVWTTLQAAGKVVILAGRRDQPTQTTIDLPASTGPHITTFSPDGRYAYIGGMGNGDLDVLRADTRRVVETVHLGPAGTHQAKASPDGSFLLAAQVPSQTLVKLAVDEAQERWTIADSLSFAQLGRAPVCTVFRDDGRRAYASLNPTGLAIVDAVTMKLVDVLPVAGFIACGMVKAPDGKSVTIASSGGGGHIYRLDTATDRLSDLGALGAPDWHSFNVTADGKLGVGSVPGSDEVVFVDLTGNQARTATVLALHPTPGIGNDQPDAIAIRGGTAWVSLRRSGKLAVIDLVKRAVVTYLDLAPPAESINPANCAGCALHGVAVRS